MGSKKKQPTLKQPPKLPDTVEELQALALKLHAQLEERTEQRDNLSRLTEELSKDLDVREFSEETQRELEALRIRKEFRDTCRDLVRAIRTCMGRLPSATDTAHFEAEEWRRLDEAIRAVECLGQDLQKFRAARFIEAEV